MDPRKNFTRFSKIVIFSALMLLTPMPAASGGFSLVSNEETQGDFLSGFNLVPGSVTVIEEQYILALFKDTEEDLYAVVLFALDCASGSCDVGEVVAYSLFDSRGVEKQLVEGPPAETYKIPRADIFLSRASIAGASRFLPLR